MLGGFLSAAIISGGWWSYEVLGWGGYWAWDPVENASIIPWFFTTAYLHSLQIQERRRMLKGWNLGLIVAAFSSTLFGTFLTRSGLVQSVHAFSKSAIGPVFLGFLAVILLGSIIIAYWRMHASGTTTAWTARSRGRVRFWRARLMGQLRLHGGSWDAVSGVWSRRSPAARPPSERHSSMRSAFRSAC